MKLLIIPDVHLKTRIFDEADAVDPNKYDNIICLGDLVDEWGMQNHQTAYEDTLERALAFDKQHPNMLWCWGNHDLSYVYALTESGFSYHMAPVVSRYMAKFESQCGKRLQVIHEIDKTLFSHAGLCDAYVQHLPLRTKSIKSILNKINKMPTAEEYMRQLWKSRSPIWLRPDDLGYLSPDTPALTVVDHWQVVGHTPVAHPITIHGMLFADNFSLYSNRTPIGDRRLIIVDTANRTWHYADK